MRGEGRAVRGSRDSEDAPGSHRGTRQPQANAGSRHPTSCAGTVATPRESLREGLPLCEVGQGTLRAPGHGTARPAEFREARGLARGAHRGGLSAPRLLRPVTMGTPTSCFLGRSRSTMKELKGDGNGSASRREHGGPPTHGRDSLAGRPCRTGGGAQHHVTWTIPGSLLTCACVPPAVDTPSTRPVLRVKAGSRGPPSREQPAPPRPPAPIIRPSSSYGGCHLPACAGSGRPT